jgi:hypothetical protein
MFLLDKSIAKELFDEVQAARAEYRRLTAAYDEELQAAHAAEHGSADFLERIKAANEMAPAMREALNWYLAAVTQMLNFYASK